MKKQAEEGFNDFWKYFNLNFDTGTGTKEES